jgi:hypothetical protein
MASKIANVFAASRWVLPEQRELYLKTKEEEKLVPMPTIEQDELETFHYMIRDAGREDYAITVTWWKPMKGSLGLTCSMWGVVKWVDQQARRIKLVNDTDVQWIPIDRIVEVLA